MRSASNDELDHHLMGMEFLSESLLTVRNKIKYAFEEEKTGTICSKL